MHVSVYMLQAALGDWSAALAMWQCTHSMCAASVQPAAAEYYTQRAFKGSFQLSEGTVVSPYGHGCAAN